MKDAEVVLITGASGEIGLGLCEKYIDLGAIIIAQYYSNPMPLEKLKVNKALDENTFILYKADFSKKKDISNMFTFIKEKFHKLDILINNAGILPKNLGYLEDGDFNDLRNVLDINIISQYLCGQFACKLMKTNNGGCIINIGSLAGRLPNYKNAFYSVSKAGLEMLTKCMAIEWAKYKIRVICVSPAAVDSPMAKEIYNTDDKLEKRIKGIPLKKLVSIESVVNTVAFLTSGDNDDITGTTIIIDGGSSLSYFNILPLL